MLWAPQAELNDIIESFEQSQKSLAFKATNLAKKGQTNTEAYKKAVAQHTFLKTYRDKLLLLPRSRTAFNLKDTGLVQQSRHPYKMGKDGKYGNLQIDVPQLVENKRRVVTGGGSVLMDEPVDSELIDLLTKRMETKRKYSNLSQDIFKKLNDLSGLQPRKRSKKYNIIKEGCIPTFYNSSDDLIDFLEFIIGSIEAGNNNNNMKNKGVE